VSCPYTEDSGGKRKEKQIPHPHSRDNLCARSPRAKRGTGFGMTIGEKAREKAASSRRTPKTATYSRRYKGKRRCHPPDGSG